LIYLTDLIMNKTARFYALAILALLLNSLTVSAQSFSMADVTNYPFPRDMTSAATGSKIAYSVEDQGRRNIYVASGADFAIHKLTNYTKDDGQELSSITITKDGKYVIYVRGGEHSGNYDRSRVANPANDPITPKIQVWSIPFAGGKPKLLGEGDYPVVSNKRVAWIGNDGHVWIAPSSGITPGKLGLDPLGTCSGLKWSPDGKKLAFACNRTDHAFIGLYTNENTPIEWVDAGFNRDSNPEWSPDGKKIVFMRSPANPVTQNGGGGFGGNAPAAVTPAAGAASGNRGAAATIPATPGAVAAPAQQRGGGGGGRGRGSLYIADLATGKAEEFFKIPQGQRASFSDFHWATMDRMVFMSYTDGWPHLYSISTTKPNPEPLLLTPGDFEVEDPQLSGDGRHIVFTGNTGPDKQLDIDRRHVCMVSVDKPDMQVLTPGDELETYPAITGDNNTVAYFSSTGQRPLVGAMISLKTHKTKLIGLKLLAANFPVKQMAIPKQVIYKSPDGTTVHAQLFVPQGGPAKKPALVYIHGGPQRQMLLGWHYMDYYSIDYALEEYLVSMGFEVLSVNYRQGIGYGYDFQRPAAGANYIDVKAGGVWLASQPDVDTSRFGVFGGSAGGALAASALARDSKLFKAGVIIHGDSPEPLDAWTSPTMIIHGDDDRNVAFSAGVSLVSRFRAKGAPYFETLVIPGDSHHWLKYSDIIKVNTAAAEFLKKELLMKK
jgi:dipeptidyl aminopeptidase/acylaminoacyl peptidase